jgi:hypothetical protein
MNLAFQQLRTLNDGLVSKKTRSFIHGLYFQPASRMALFLQLSDH